MTISPETMHQLHQRAGGRCECTMTECSDHVGRCNELLGEDWHARHRSDSGFDNLRNLIAMCQSCHRNTEHLENLNQNDFEQVS